MKTEVPSPAPGSVVASSSDASSYPGGKSGAGIYQRLINWIPPHRVFVAMFAGHCGIVRNIQPAEHTIVIDRDPTVCDWWDSWRRSKQGRDLEIHNCDGIEWVRYRFGVTKYSASPGCDAGSVVAAGSDAGSRDKRSQNSASHPSVSGPDAKQCGTRATHFQASTAGDAKQRDAAESQGSTAEAFIFADPPYVLSERTGKIYACEMSDDDHKRFLGTVTRLNASAARVMVCGYDSRIYSILDYWESIDHRVPTRGGLQDEKLWMNYPRPEALHDYRYIGDGRRSRERIRRRQKNWLSQLNAMSDREREAMLRVLNDW